MLVKRCLDNKYRKQKVPDHCLAGTNTHTGCPTLGLKYLSNQYCSLTLKTTYIFHIFVLNTYKYVSHDTDKICLTLALNTNQSINQSIVS